MSTIVSKSSAGIVAPHHARFLEMLPIIRRMAGFLFRRAPRSIREDLVAETVANCYVAFARLVERGKVEVAFPTVLTRYAVRGIRSGRRVGNRTDIRDLLSITVQRRHGFLVQGLRELDERGNWKDLIVEDKKTRPAEVAVCRVDFRAWLATLSVRDRRVAESLAAGSSTGSVACQFQISDGRVSQLRRELHDSWKRFHGEDAQGQEACVLDVA